jgi:Zn ribbon nucleic-acid-binding protein
MDKDKKISKSVEIPICPFCDGKVHYTSWLTHKIYQMECEKCGSHWRSGINESETRDIYIELTKTISNEKYEKYLFQKYSLNFWRDMIRERIRF